MKRRLTFEFTDEELKILKYALDYYTDDIWDFKFLTDEEKDQQHTIADMISTEFGGVLYG